MFGFKKKENNLDKEYFEIERYCPVCHKTHIQKLYNPEKLKTADRYLDGCYKISAEDYTSVLDLCPHCGFLMYKDEINDSYYTDGIYLTKPDVFLKNISIIQSIEYQNIFHSNNLTLTEKKIKLFKLFGENKTVFEYIITYSTDANIKNKYIKKYIDLIEKYGYFSKIHSRTSCINNDKIIPLDKHLILIDLYRQIGEMQIANNLILKYKSEIDIIHDESSPENQYCNYEKGLIDNNNCQHL